MKWLNVNQIADVLTQEECALMDKKGRFCFEAQVQQSIHLFGKRFVKTHILGFKEGKKRANFFEQNGPLVLDVPRNVFKSHSLVIVGGTGKCEVYTTATNHPEMEPYRLGEKPHIYDTYKKHITDFVGCKSNWASISTAQMRWIYRNKYKQKQEAQQIENLENHVQDQLKNERQLQFIRTEPPIFPNKYDAAGRNVQYGSIGIGLVA